MKKYLLLFSLPLFTMFTACDPKDSPDSGDVVVVTENITSPTTWTSDKIWKIENSIYVNSDLEIEPGTIIKMAENVGLYIGFDTYAAISALGTEDDPILFTSASNNSSPGDWKSLFFNDANSSSGTKFTWCTFEYGGGGNEDNGMIELYETGISMNHCTVRMSEYNGIVLYYESEFTSFNNNTIEDCGRHCIICDANAVGTIEPMNVFYAENGFGIQTGGYVDKNGTWYDFEVPYYLNDHLSVESENGNVVWTISPGVTILCGPGHYIWIGSSYFAKIVANGTLLAPITFSSAASTPSKGDWDALVLGDYISNSSVINYCNIWYSGGDGSGAIYVSGENNTITISNCNIAHSSSNGIYIWYANPVLIDNTFTDNNGQNVSGGE